MTDRDLIDALTHAADHLSAKPYNIPSQRLAADLRRVIAEREAQYAELLAFLARPQGDIEGDHGDDDDALLDYIGGDALRAAWDARDRWYA